MSKSNRTGLHAAAAAALSLCLGAAHAQTSVATEEQALDSLIREAMLYAYPYQEFMKMRHEALEVKDSPTATTLNHFRHSRHLATPKDRWANGPIRDTFYSTAWLDLEKSPMLLSLPETHGRYYVVAMIGADLNTFSYAGRRLGGTQARTVALVGPRWSGKVPQVDQIVRAPTRDVYLNLRVLVTGEDDLEAAHAVQDGFHIAPLLPTAEDSPRLRPRAQDWGRFVDVANEALVRNPPPGTEQKLLERFASVGICGKPCRWDKLPDSVQQRWLTLAPEIEKNELKNRLNADRRTTDPGRRNGWTPYRLPDGFGTDYAMRAQSAAMSGGILGLTAAEATYFAASVDTNNQALGKGQAYRLHLPQGRLPADAFWSVSLYEFVTGGQYMVDNPINRYAIGDRTKGLKFNADGSLDIWLQPTDPGPEKRANWLPTPAKNLFYLMARAYQPWPEVLDPSWTPEPVQPIHAQ
ncbi:DUF1254 domain-containing protein [Comamonas testosteroni]|uniref:DUF1254 domain-containing protein n=1 Tax=Comamonas testosteroni TaxID=285 RepID=UPI002DBAB20B|nr:DUF1254 domain-containing protein [Comamonas testosteroni]MEB5964991.1 DUF1254 domain-containing protein [Comamonas testosteroni]